jgi:hypothetical protein
MLCPALLGIFSMTKTYLALLNPNPNLTLLLVFGNPVILLYFGNLARIKCEFFFKLIAVAIAAAAANVLSCWILPFIILDGKCVCDVMQSDILQQNSKLTFPYLHFKVDIASHTMFTFSSVILALII